MSIRSQKFKNLKKSIGMLLLVLGFYIINSFGSSVLAAEEDGLTPPDDPHDSLENFPQEINYLLEDSDEEVQALFQKAYDEMNALLKMSDEELKDFFQNSQEEIKDFLENPQLLFTEETEERDEREAKECSERQKKINAYLDSDDSSPNKKFPFGTIIVGALIGTAVIGGGIAWYHGLWAPVKTAVAGWKFVCEQRRRLRQQAGLIPDEIFHIEF